MCDYRLSRHKGVGVKRIPNPGDPFHLGHPCSIPPAAIRFLLFLKLVHFFLVLVECFRLVRELF